MHSCDAWFMASTSVLLVGADTSIIFITTKVSLWQTRFLSWNKHHFSHDKSFVVTNTFFVMTKVCFSRQNVCHDKIMFVRTKHTVRCSNNVLFAWGRRGDLLSDDKLLSQQKWYFWQLLPMIHQIPTVPSSPQHELVLVNSEVYHLPHQQNHNITISLQSLILENWNWSLNLHTEMCVTMSKYDFILKPKDINFTLKCVSPWINMTLYLNPNT